MSLASAITTAQTIFSNTGLQTAVVAKNIQNAQNPDYARRLAMMTVSGDGYTISIQRAQNDALFRQNLTYTSNAGAQARLGDGLEMLRSVLGGNNYPSSPSSYLNALRTSLQTYSSSSGNLAAGATAVATAKDLANSLNTASAAAQELRAVADREIKDQVKDLNSYLASFEEVNNGIVGAMASGKDASDLLDKRDGLLKSISSIIGISTVERQNHDTVIYSSDGAVLFETLPRKVTFTPTENFDVTVTGGAIAIDGVTVKPGSGGNTSSQGTLTALLQLRDTVAPEMQKQLDEIARGLIKTFAESDPDPATAPVLATKAGLFQQRSGTTTPITTVPPDGIWVPGLAASIMVNPIAVSDPTKLRDGGMNGTGYIANPTGAAGYSAHLDSYVSAMSTKITFDPAAGLSAETTIMDYASSSVGWLEQLRKSSASAETTKSAMLAQTSEALSKETGVSLDEELSLMLDLEQSYKASSRLLSTVDQMIQSLLDSVR
ncbi:flagellar hook-associated protein FlgK [Rhizobium sp. YIM 134829]|uniref:flagellar hook-associated protein FlgK n=1 Tax=Rhizobium sp. YIM 134829 TaxID=3390453 RepID=UPI00397D3337